MRERTFNGALSRAGKRLVFLLPGPAHRVFGTAPESVTDADMLKGIVVLGDKPADYQVLHPGAMNAATHLET
jgi:hypothetical protein